MQFQEFASERELCWHLCITMGLAGQHERLAQALGQTGIDPAKQPKEWRAQAQVSIMILHVHDMCKTNDGVLNGQCIHVLAHSGHGQQCVSVDAL